jgi:membrane protease YdiL (CAAX protease family)
VGGRGHTPTSMTVAGSDGGRVARAMHQKPRWTWQRWTRWPFSGPVIAVAALAVTVDAVTAWAGVSFGELGRVPVSPALPLGFLLAAMIGLKRLGLDRANRRAWREFLIVGTAVLIYSAVSYAVSIGGTAEAFGLVIAALGEELVYRLAVIVVVGALCARLLGRDWRNASEWGLAPGLIALLVGSVVFSLLPGHVAQMSDALHALPFASLGLVLGYAVLRTGALIPATIVHALLNLVTLAVLAGHMSVSSRGALSAAALFALLAGTVTAGLRLGILHRTPAEVDLPAVMNTEAPA